MCVGFLYGDFLKDLPNVHDIWLALFLGGTAALHIFTCTKSIAELVPETLENIAKEKEKNTQ